jgi:hypothetical protein
MKRALPFALTAMVVLFGCASPTPSATPTPEPSPSAAAHTPTSTATGTPTLTPTETPTVAPTCTPVPRYTLSGIVFHDWNADCVKGIAEPPVPGADICIDSADSGMCSLSGQDGSYSIPAVPAGQHTLPIQPAGYPFHIASTAKALALDIETPSVVVTGDTVCNLALAEGPLSLPIRCRDVDEPVDVENYFDVDPSPEARDWMGGTQTYDGHDGVDFRLKGDVEIVAVLPGVVDYIGDVVRPGGAKLPNDLSVHVQTDLTDPWCPTCGPLRNQYAHLQDVSVRVGQRVDIGDAIGWSRESLYPSLPGDPQHVHFMNTHRQGSTFIPFDPFKDLQDPGSHNYRTRYNDPACF